jgi:hypothetical protein
MDNPEMNTEVLDYAAPSRAIPRPPRPPVVRIVVFGLLLFPLTVNLVYPVAYLLPFGWTTWVIVQIPTSGGGPNVESPVEVEASGPGSGPSVPMTLARTWWWTRADDRFGITVDLNRMTYLIEPRLSRPAPFTAAAVQKELEQHQVNPGEAEVVAAAVVAKLQDLALGRLPEDAGLGTGSRPRAHRWTSMQRAAWPPFLRAWPWYTPWCVPVWLVTWVLLAKWLLRRHRRRLAAFNDRSPS